MVTIGGNENGSAHPVSNRPPLLARVAGTLAATALIVSTGSSVLAAPAAPKITASPVAIVSAGGGANLTGASLSSIEVFKLGSQLNSGPTQYLHGSAVGLLNATDIKYSPGDNFFAVSNSATALGGTAAVGGATYIYSAAANGNQGPVQSLISPSTDIPDGVSWDADGDLWVADFGTPSCAVTAPGVCNSKSIDICPVPGTIEEFVPNGSTLTAPNVMYPIPVRVIKACSSVYTSASARYPGTIITSGIVAPVGIAVSPGEGSVQVCVPGYPTSNYGCGALGGVNAPIGYYGKVYTHAVFVVDSATGTITVYEPELEEAIGNGIAFGRGLISEDFGVANGTPDTIVEAMAPLGSGLTGLGEFVDPQYIAFGATGGSGPQLLVTDARGGPVGRGSISSIPTYISTAPFCAQPFGTTPATFANGCTVLVEGGKFSGETPTVISSSSNPHIKDLTGLRSPEGIAALVSAKGYLDAIFVANPLTGQFEQFAPTASGNASPAVVIGGNTNLSKMILPWGLTIPNAEAVP
ncbi:MAG TPA: hypothetical protein VMA09_01490 [Candidatus Binataceae bacterium]|nr:hypothetical protein [Candidatus Binataceae bacterium]